MPSGVHLLFGLNQVMRVPAAGCIGCQKCSDTWFDGASPIHEQLRLLTDLSLCVAKPACCISAM